MIVIAVLFVFCPFGLILLDMLTQKNYKVTKDVPTDKIRQIEELFEKVMENLENHNSEGLKNIYGQDLFHQYIKKVNSNKIKDRQSYIEHACLEGITDYKLKRNGFSVNMSYRAISYSTFDKKRYEIYWRRIDYLFTPLGNGILGDSENYTRFQQRWFFEERNNQLKIVKIKNYRLKNK